MTQTSTTVTRRELYEQVWSEPMVILARRYGLSDVGLAKICRKHGIPRPPRGYWAKKKGYRERFKAKLPKPNAEEVIVITAYPTGMTGGASNETKSSTSREEKIVVSESLERAHPLVKGSKQLLAAGEMDKEGLLIPPKGCLDIRVSKETLRRALLIINALLKFLESRGYVVDAIDKGTTVTVGDIKVRFSIKEQLEGKRIDAKQHPLEGYYDFGYSRYERVKVRSGRLSLEIHDDLPCWQYKFRRKWSDTENRKIENGLNGFVAGLLKTAWHTKEYLLEKERSEREKLERERARQEAERSRAEKLELIRAERARVDRLLQDAENWRKSCLLRDYIEAKRRFSLGEGGAMSPSEDFAAWFEWALQQADRLDPLKESPRSVLDLEHELSKENEGDTYATPQSLWRNS